MKKVVLWLFLLILPVSFADAQACGGSIRKIELTPDKKTGKTGKVSYQLFYLVPKGKSVSELWESETTEFVSNFYYGAAKKETFQFWMTDNETTGFLNVPREKAEKYLQNYNLQDFKIIYEDGYRKHHLKQLKGEFNSNHLELETGEQDNTPFLLKISADGFETQYFLADFLGGCHRYDKQIVKMKYLGKYSS